MQSFIQATESDTTQQSWLFCDLRRLNKNELKIKCREIRFQSFHLTFMFELGITSGFIIAVKRTGQRWLPIKKKFLQSKANSI